MLASQQEADAQPPDTALACLEEVPETDIDNVEKAAE